MYLSLGSVRFQEMSKAGCKLPLLIGGATTSKMHTAVKISPQYASPEVQYALLDSSGLFGLKFLVELSSLSSASVGC